MNIEAKKYELQDLDPNAKGKLYIKRHASHYTNRTVEVFYGVKVKNVSRILGRLNQSRIERVSMTIGSKRKTRMLKFIKINF